MIKLMPDQITFILLGAISVIGLLLYFFEYRSHRKLRTQIESKDHKALEQKSFEVLHNAVKKSQDMLTQAELDSVNLAAKTFHNTNDLEVDYQKELKAFQSSLTHLLEQTTQQTLQDFSTYLETLKTQSKTLQATTDELVTKRTKESLDIFAEELRKVVKETEAQSLKSLDIDKKEIQAGIEEYKENQIKAIDENILAVVEKTVSTVLAKRLTLKDHMELIYDSLERAKADNFILPTRPISLPQEEAKKGK